MPTPYQLERRYDRNRPQAGELWESKPKYRFEPVARLLIIAEKVDFWGNTVYSAINMEDGDIISDIEIGPRRFKRVN